MSTFLYTRPTDRLRGTVVVGTGTEDSGYPAANLDDDQPDKPGKLTTTSGAWVRDLGTASRCDVVALIHHNLDEGLEVRLQGNPTNVWTAPAVNAAFALPAPYVDRFRVNVWLDLTTLYPIDAARTMQFWRLVVVGVNTAPVALGEWAMFGILRNLGIRNIKWGSQRAWRRPAIIHETDYLVRRMYAMATVVRAVEVDIDPTNDTLREVDAWQRSSLGPTLPFLIVPHRDETDAWFVAFVNQDQPYTRQHLNYNPARLSFQEMSRGLYP